MGNARRSRNQFDGDHTFEPAEWRIEGNIQIKEQSCACGVMRVQVKNLSGNNPTRYYISGGMNTRRMPLCGLVPDRID